MRNNGVYFIYTVVFVIIAAATWYSEYSIEDGQHISNNRLIDQPHKYVLALLTGIDESINNKNANKNESINEKNANKKNHENIVKEDIKQVDNDLANRLSAREFINRPIASRVASNDVTRKYEKINTVKIIISLPENMPIVSSDQKFILRLYYRDKVESYDFDEFPISPNIVFNQTEIINFSIFRKEIVSSGIFGSKIEEKRWTGIGSLNFETLTNEKSVTLKLPINHSITEKKSEHIELSIKPIIKERKPETVKSLSSSNKIVEYSADLNPQEARDMYFVIPNTDSITYLLVWCATENYKNIFVKRTDTNETIGVYSNKFPLIAVAADGGASLNIVSSNGKYEENEKFIIFSICGEETCASDLLMYFIKNSISKISVNNAVLTKNQIYTIIKWIIEAFNITLSAEYIRSNLDPYTANEIIQKLQPTNVE